MKNIKNKIIGTVALLLSVLSLNAAVVSVVLPSATAYNVPTTYGTNAASRLLSLTITGTTTNSPVVYFFDSTYQAFVITNAAYNIRSSYATNYVTIYTNYYGATNTFTNLALVDITNTVAAATNTLSPVFIATAPTNTTVQYDNISVSFLRGIWLTNQVAGAAFLNLTYTQ